MYEIDTIRFHLAPNTFFPGMLWHEQWSCLLEDFGGRFWNLGGSWGHCWGSWTVFGHLFWYLDSSLGHFLWSWRLLGAPWVSKWIPEPTFVDFGWLLGFILGGFCESGWGLGGHLGAFWWPLGGLWLFFFGFVLKSVKLWKVLFYNNKTKLLRRWWYLLAEQERFWLPL